MIVPLIAEAITLPEAGHYPQSSDIHGYALEAHGIFNVSDTSDDKVSASPATAGEKAYTAVYEQTVVSAVYGPQKAQNSPVRAEREQDMLSYIEQKESKGDPLAQNKHSTAFGRFQFLDSTWETVGCVKTSDPKEQERCAILYMEQRYGGIEGAYRFHLRNNYY